MKSFPNYIVINGDSHKITYDLNSIFKIKTLLNTKLQKLFIWYVCLQMNKVGTCIQCALSVVISGKKKLLYEGSWCFHFIKRLNVFSRTLCLYII